MAYGRETFTGTAVVLGMQRSDGREREITKSEPKYLKPSAVGTIMLHKLKTIRTGYEKGN